jgi:NEDD8-activating enzyme E1
MDTIDISNLNRQFLFRYCCQVDSMSSRLSLFRSRRPKDVGKPKAIVAAEFIMKRVPEVVVTPLVIESVLFSYVLLTFIPRYYGKIQDKDDDYYMQFNLVICGLDSVEARRWINATLVNLVDQENPESLKPLIDGGTEGLIFHNYDFFVSHFQSRLQGSSPSYPAHCNVVL